MKIGINIFPLERKNFTGIELYTQRLLEGLLKRNAIISGYSYTRVENEIVNSLNSYSYFTANKNANILNKLLYNLYGVNKFIREDEVFHGTFFSLPFNIKARKKIVTIHDLAFKKFPQFFDNKSLLFYKLNLDYSLKKADRIICVSNSCYEDLLEFYPNNVARKGRVVYNGFDFPDIQHENMAEFDLSRYGKYLLFVGAHHPRKNIENMLNAYSIFSQTGYPYNIVFTGNVDNKIFEVFLGKYPHLKKSIFCVGYINKSLLQKFYKHAELLLLPSLYEGFGFPILEAMSVGTPVLTSITSSCKEISGYDDCYLVEPSDPRDIAEKLHILLKEDIRTRLITYGNERIKQFSWHRMVEETIQVYND